MRKTLATCLLLAAATASTARTAHAQSCSGTPTTFETWQGTKVYRPTVAATADGSVVAWSEDQDDGEPGRDLHVRHIAADGTIAAGAGEDAEYAASGQVLAMVGGPSAIVQLTDDRGINIVVRDSSGAPGARAHFGDAPIYGASSAQISRDGDGFLVSWKSGIDDNTVLEAVRLDAHGVPRDAAPIVLGPAYAYDVWNGAARIGGVTWVMWSTFASNDAEFEDGAAPDLVGVRIADDGHVVDAAPVLLVARATGVGLAANGDAAFLVAFVEGTGYRAMTIDAGGDVGAPTPTPLADDVPLLGILPTPGSSGFTLWTFGDPSGVLTAQAYPVTHAGAIAATPSLTLNTEARAVTTDGQDELLLAVDTDADPSSTTGEERLALRRIAGADVTVTTALDTAALQRTTAEECLDDENGCQAGGAASPGAMVLIGLALAFARRRRPAR